MIEIKTLLQKEIYEGLVNWDKFAPKIAAVIENLKHTNIATLKDGSQIPVSD